MTFYPGWGPKPGSGPFTSWQKMVSMAVFGVVYGGMAGYLAVIADWTAFALVTGLALLALGSSLGGLRIWREQKARQAASELQRQSKTRHRDAPPHHSRRRHH